MADAAARAAAAGAAAAICAAVAAACCAQYVSLAGHLKRLPRRHLHAAVRVVLHICEWWDLSSRSHSVARASQFAASITPAKLFTVRAAVRVANLAIRKNVRELASCPYYKMGLPQVHEQRSRAQRTLKLVTMRTF